jgi:hypothetical protein
MRRLIILTPAFVLIAACGSGPTEQEQNLPEREQGPEVLANTGMGNEVTPGTAPAVEQSELGDTMPDKPAGPVSDSGSETDADPDEPR